MKTALLITNEKSKDLLTYNRIEFIKALEEKNYNVHVFDVENADDNDREMIISTVYDFAIIVSRMSNFSGSSTTENYRANLSLLIDLYNEKRIIFVNDLISHLDTCNKWLSTNKLIACNTPIVKTSLVVLNNAPREEDGSVIYENLDLSTLDSNIEQVGGFPLVYKRLYGAEGKHVHLVKNRDELKTLLDAERTGPLGFILQEYVNTAECAMFCVRVVGEQIFTRMFIGSPYDIRPFKSITATGRQQLPCITTEEIKTIAISAVKALGLDTARIDMFITEDGIKICEVNSIGSLLPTDQTHNVHIAELIVDLAIKKQEQLLLESTNDTDNQP